MGKRKHTDSGLPESVTLFQTGYAGLAEKWISVFLCCGLGATCLVGVIEGLFFFLTARMGLLQVTPLVYFIKYFFLPCGFNGACVLGAWVVKRRARQLRTKAYAVSMMFVLLAFCIYTVHVQFTAMAICFALVIFVTCIYGDRKLTSCTAGAALVLKLVSDVFIVWNPAAPRYTPGDPNYLLDLAVSGIALGAIYVVSLVSIGIERERYGINVRLEREKLLFRDAALRDELTGIGNRSALRQAFDRMITHGDGGRYTFVMADMDRFKEINDTYGHNQGDLFLQRMASALDEVTGAEVFRYGGDEFCLLFRNVEREEILYCCERAQTLMRQGDSGAGAAEVTMSFGASGYLEGVPLSELVHQADLAMYYAKRTGQRLCFFEDIPEDEVLFLSAAKERFVCQGG